MARRILKTNWNRRQLDDTNENFKELYEGVKDAKENATLKENSIGKRELQNDSVGSANIENNAVDSFKIRENAVYEKHIVNGQVTRWKIKDGEVVGGKLSENAVTTIKINNFAVTTDKLAGKSVTGSKIDNETIVETNIKSEAITRRLIKGRAVASNEIELKGIKSENIADNAIKPEQAVFINVEIGKNLFNKDDIIMNKEVSSAHGKLSDRDNYLTSNFVKVRPSSTITCSHLGRMALFDESLAFVKGVEPSDSKTIIIPSNVHYLMKSVDIKVKDTLQIEQGNSSTPFEPYQQKNTLDGIDLSSELSEFGNFLTNEVLNADFSKQAENWVVGNFTPTFNATEITMSSLARNEMILSQKLTSTEKPKKDEVWYISINSKNINAKVKNAYFHFRDWIVGGTFNRYININKTTSKDKNSSLINVTTDFLDFISFYVRLELNEVLEGQKFLLEKPVCINLTKLYGKGNEPTLEEFESYLKIGKKDFISGKENIFDAKKTQELQAKQLEVNKDIENRLAISEKTGGGIFSGAQKTRGQTLTKASPYSFTQTSGSTLPKKKMWVITYDDESKSILDYALPIHIEENVPGIFYVVPDRISTDDTYFYGKACTWEDLRTLEKNGIEIGHHTYQHRSTGFMNRDKLIKNIETGNKIFIENGFSPTNFCHPGGSNTMENSVVLTEYFDSCVLTVNDINGYDCNPWRLARKSSDNYGYNNIKYLDQLIESDKGLLMTYHHAIHPNGVVEGNEGQQKCWTTKELKDAIKYAKENEIEIVAIGDALRTYAPHIYYFNEDKQPIFSVQRDGLVVNN